MEGDESFAEFSDPGGDDARNGKAHEMTQFARSIPLPRRSDCFVNAILAKLQSTKATMR